MANVIKHKRGSGSDPAANDLVVGEVAIRTDVGKLFTKMDNGSVAEIAGGGSDIAINTLSSSSGTGGGSATFNGSAFRFTLSSPPSVSAQQLLVSINGVIQKPVAGTGQPSEGFSVDGTDIILGDAPETGADFFILTFKSLGVSEPADNSVTSAKIVDGAIVNADINASAAIAGTKISPDFGSQNIVTTGSITGNDLEIDSGTLSVDASNNRVGIGTTSPVNPLHVVLSGTDIATFESTDAGNNGAQVSFKHTSASPADNDTIANLSFDGRDSGNNATTYAQLRVLATDVTNTDESGAFQFFTRDVGSFAERMRIDSSGRVLVGTTTSDTGLLILDKNITAESDPSDTANYHFVIRSQSNSNTSKVGIAFKNTSDNTDVGAAILHHRTGGGSVGDLAFYTSPSAGTTTQRMLINSSGQVGIGTTSPTSSLHVSVGSSGTNSSAGFNEFCIEGGNEDIGMCFLSPAANNRTHTIAFGDSNNNAAGKIQYNHSTDDLTLTASDNIIFTGDAVGIGTTSPSGKLDVRLGGTGTIAEFRGADTDLLHIDGDSNQITLDARNVGALAFEMQGSEAMRIDSSGRVGIGLVSPLSNSVLHVKSSDAADYRPLVVEGSATNGSGISIHNSGAQRIFIGSGGGNNLSGSSTSDGVIRTETNTVFAVGNQEKMRIDSSGQVGIGITSPSQKLNVSGNILATGTITPNSDIAFKKDIKPLTNVLNKVTKLLGINFTYKNNNERSMGLLAQDVEKIFPELVRGVEGNKSLNYMGLTGALIEAIKELAAKVEALEEK